MALKEELEKLSCVFTMDTKCFHQLFLHAKIKNVIPSKVIADATNKNMINFICHYTFLTRAYNQKNTHLAVAEYLPEVKAEYLNGPEGR